MKHYLSDGVVGLVLAIALFFLAPLILYAGNWGVPRIGAFPYFLVGVFLFLIYSRTPLYKRQHAPGAGSFSAALAAFIGGTVVGYGTIMLLAAFSVSQWSLAL